MLKRQHKIEYGFTIIELLISVAIFTIIVFFCLGSVVVIFSSNKKSESIRTAIDNANFALETMTRDIKFGSNFQYVGDFNFDAADGSRISYRLENGQIVKKVGSGYFLPLTSSVYRIDDFRFTVKSDEQPLVTVFLKGTALPSSKEATDFSLQTTISPRQLNTE